MPICVDKLNGRAGLEVYFLKLATDFMLNFN